MKKKTGEAPMETLKNIFLTVSLLGNVLLLFVNNQSSSLFEAYQANWTKVDDSRINDFIFLEALLVNRIDLEETFTILSSNFPEYRYSYDSSKLSITTLPIDKHLGPTLRLDFDSSSKKLSRIWINTFARNE